MTYDGLRKKIARTEAARKRAEQKYKHAKKGSASAKYWLARRQNYWRDLVKLRKKLKAMKPAYAELVVAYAQGSAADYRRRPYAYHYLAGGVQNTSILPTPFNYRSDCSQWDVQLDRLAGGKCPGSGTFMASNTATIAQGGTIVSKCAPGDHKVWCRDPRRPRSTTHHIERVIDYRGTTIGHGTRQIDSLAPGGYFFYLRFNH